MDTPPIRTADAAPYRPADRLAAGLAAIALLGSLWGTTWFFLGFIENDPEFRASSSAFLLSLGLGAFAIIPSAVILRLAMDTVRKGFRPSYGLWTLVLALPWVVLSVLMMRFAPIPIWPPLAAFVLSALLSLWALISLILHWRA